MRAKERNRHCRTEREQKRDRLKETERMTVMSVRKKEGIRVEETEKATKERERETLTVMHLLPLDL